jgi:3-deoxy-D-manno-octulosonic-acid transferase
VTLAICEKARVRFPHLRVFVVPRPRERFDEVARLMERKRIAFVRRSQVTAPCREPVVLVDTMGELAALWGLADVAFVGGSLDGKRGGQNMIEPAAYGAAVAFGPNTWNFRDIVASLVAADGAVVVQDAQALDAFVCRCLVDPAYATALGTRAQQLVKSQLGATRRTIHLIESLFRQSAPTHTSVPGATPQQSPAAGSSPWPPRQNAA